MPSALSVGDITVALQPATLPGDNHVEPSGGPSAHARPSTARCKPKFAIALWMLTKQWQMGEFRGSDAGSPVFAKLLLVNHRLTKYRPAGGSRRNCSTRPLPWKPRSSVAQFRWHRQQRILALDLRLVMARQWFA